MLALLGCQLVFAVWRSYPSDLGCLQLRLLRSKQARLLPQEYAVNPDSLPHLESVVVDLEEADFELVELIAEGHSQFEFTSMMEDLHGSSAAYNLELVRSVFSRIEAKGYADARRILRGIDLDRVRAARQIDR